MIPRPIVERILNTADIEEVIGEQVRLKRTGQNLIGLCPFHDEKTPSFNVSPAKGIYKCFGCGKGGDVISFLMEHEKCSYPEAIKMLADRYHIELPETKEKTAEEVEKETERESIHIALSFAQKFYETQLWKAAHGQTVGLPYLKEKRGFTERSIRKFGLGISPNAYEDFLRAAEKKQFKKEILSKAGLISEGKRGPIDRFRNRIMFPIYSISGRVVAFGARDLSGDKKAPKYLNSPETLVYHKSEILYGLFQSKKAIRQQNECFLVEGYTDVIGLHQKGIENVIASSGTSLTDGQVKIIKRFTQKICFIFDGDAAGVKATVKGIHLALENAAEVRVLTLPEGEDPDSFAQANTHSELKKYLQQNQQDGIFFLYELWKSETRLDDPTQKSRLIKQLSATIACVRDQVLQHIYIKELAEKLGVEEDLIYREVKIEIKNKFFKDQAAPATSAKEEDSGNRKESIVAPINTKEKSARRQEHAFIKALLLYGAEPYDEERDVATFMLEEIEEIEWEDKSCRKIMEKFHSAFADGNILSAQDMLHTEDAEINALVGGFSIELYQLSKRWAEVAGMPIDDLHQKYRQEVRAVITHLKLKKILLLIKENNEQLKTTQDPEKVEELLIVHQYLNQIKQSLSKQLGTVIVA